MHAVGVLLTFFFLGVTLTLTLSFKYMFKLTKFMEVEPLESNLGLLHANARES